MGDTSLATQYQLSPYLLTKGVILNLEEESEILDSLNFDTIKATTVQTYRSGKMRPVSWRRINKPFGTVIQGHPEPIMAGMFSFGNTVDVDYLYKEDTTPKIVDPETDQIKSTTTAMARQFNEAWVSNTPQGNPDAIVGIRHMIDTEFPGQKICANPTGLDVLDLSPTGANYSTNISIFFLMLDKAIEAIHGQKPTLAVCNSTFLTHFASLCRDSGYLKTTEDSLGRVFVEYRGVKFVNAGNTVEDHDDETGQDLPIITNKETYNGVVDEASGNATSIMFARVDKEHYQPFQFEDLTVDRIGKLQDGVNYRTVIKWDIGHIVTHRRSLSWLTGLKFM